MRSKILERILHETPLSIKLKVSNEMAFIMLLTELGFRENKMWDERDEKEQEVLAKLIAFAEKHTDSQLREIKAHVAEHGSIELSKPKKECVNKIDGSCPLHNIHCQYPECEVIDNK